MRQSLCGLRKRVCKKSNKREHSAHESSESQVASQPKGHTSAVREEDVAAKEAQDLAERRIPDGSTSARAVAAQWHVLVAMKLARKLVLVDENDREYKRLQRRVDDVSKTAKSLQLSDTLRDRSLADDRKVREYVATLYKYLNTRREVPVEPAVQVNTETLPPTPPPPTRSARRRRGRHAWVQY